VLRPDASALAFQPPSTNRDINWSAPSNTAQFNAPSKPHSPRTVFNTENYNLHHTTTLAIFPHQYSLTKSSITKIPTTIPIRNTHHGQKPHGKASQHAILRHPSRKDSSTYRFLHNTTTNQTTITTQELFTRSSYLICSSNLSSQISITYHQIFTTIHSQNYYKPQNFPCPQTPPPTKPT
jgi:hypothetical protein